MYTKYLVLFVGGYLEKGRGGDGGGGGVTWNNITVTDVAISHVITSLK